VKEKLNAFKSEKGKRPYNVPSSMMDTTHRATVELVASSAARRALKAGYLAPAFVLKDSDGNEISLKTLLKKSSLVITFYRGVWCPYSNKELQALQATLPEYRKLAADLVAISPQTAANNRRAVRENNLCYPILSDPRNDVAATFGLRFELPDYLVELYKKLKNDLPSFNGDPSWTLPMPARYVIDRDGIIVYSEVCPDCTYRPEPKELLPVLRRAQEDAGARDAASR